MRNRSRALAFGPLKRSSTAAATSWWMSPRPIFCAEHRAQSRRGPKTPADNLVLVQFFNSRMDMDVSALLLSRIQFAFTVSFHIIFPAFTVGLAAWLAVLEGLSLGTGHPVYKRLFDFWLRIFGVAFGLGVVSGIVMAFEFGTNWSELSRRT